MSRPFTLQARNAAAGAARSASLKDPVCGMAVTPKSFHSLQHEGHTIYFCGANCKARFAGAPGKFAGAHGARTPAAAAPLSGATLRNVPVPKVSLQEAPLPNVPLPMASLPAAPSLKAPSLQASLPNAGEEQLQKTLRRRFWWLLALALALTALVVLGIRLA